MKRCSAGATSSRHSTALNTEIAGVITPSPRTTHRTRPTPRPPRRMERKTQPGDPAHRSPTPRRQPPRRPRHRRRLTCRRPRHLHLLDRTRQRSTLPLGSQPNHPPSPTHPRLAPTPRRHRLHLPRHLLRPTQDIRQSSRRGPSRQPAHRARLAQANRHHHQRPDYDRTARQGLTTPSGQPSTLCGQLTPETLSCVPMRVVSCPMCKENQQGLTYLLTLCTKHATQHAWVHNYP